MWVGFVRTSSSGNKIENARFQRLMTKNQIERRPVNPVTLVIWRRSRFPESV